MSTAKKNRLQEWENENQQQLLRLVESSQDLTKQNLLRAARLTSFLLYIGYGAGKLSFAFARSLFVGPQLQLQIAPEVQPLERYEFETVHQHFPRH